MPLLLSLQRGGILAAAGLGPLTQMISNSDFFGTLPFSPHPYLFFNSDCQTFTFVGFYVDANSGNILEPGSRNVLQEKAMSKDLIAGLAMNKVPLTEEFDTKLTR